MFNPHWGNILSLELFCFHIAKPLIPTLELLPMLCVCEKLTEHMYDKF